MPITAPDLRMPLDAADKHYPALGSSAPNKTADYTVESRIVRLTSGAAGVTQFTGASGSGLTAMFLEPYGIYELSCLVPPLGTVTSAFWLFLMFGKDTDPASGDFPAVPAAGAPKDAWAWNPWIKPSFEFTALPGQKRLAGKNNGVDPDAAGGVTSGTYITLRRLR